MSLIQTDPLAGDPTTPIMPPKTIPGSMLPPTMLPGSFPIPSASSLRRPGPQRLDLEPVYAELKKLVGEHWALYRESVGLFILGSLNQEELSRRIDPFVCTSALTTHLHNQFIAGVYSNSLREPPETEIAPFVSTHSKPPVTIVVKPGSTGDAAEQRLKAEIMALPARERYRLKQLAEAGVGNDAFQQMMRSVKDSRSVKPPDVVPASAGGFNKTNWELEIAKRFELPLFWESNEFPDADSISNRMVPMCYQEGLAGGCGNGCSDLINVAAEAFIKQMLTESFRRVRSNAVNYVQSAKFRRKLVWEEEKCRQNEIQRDGFGLLPIEAEVERLRPHFGLEDLRFGLSMGNSYMAQNKILKARIFNRALQRQENKELEHKYGLHGVQNGLPLGVNGGTMNGLINGMNKSASDLMPGWRTSSGPLDDVLDDVLEL